MLGSLLCSTATISWLLNRCHAFWMLNQISVRLISLHHSFSWKLLIASHCPCSLCHPISPQLISPHVFSAFFTSSHVIPSHVSSPFLSCPRPFSYLLSSPQHVSSSYYLFSPLIISSKLFSHLLSWSQLFSARLTSSQRFSPHSQLISALLWPKICSKNGSRRHSKRP